MIFLVSLKYREIISVKTVTFFKNLYFFSLKVLKARKNLALTLFYCVSRELCFIMSGEKYGWAIQKSLFAKTDGHSTFSHTRENSKMFNITSKYISFLNHLQAESRI